MIFFIEFRLNKKVFVTPRNAKCLINVTLALKSARLKPQNAQSMAKKAPILPGLALEPKAIKTESVLSLSSVYQCLLKNV